MKIEFVLYIIAGFILLTLSGNFLVKGAVSIAKYLRVSTLVIGATVVSMGTSAPELIVSVNAALEGFPSISLGNIIGSNISNIALVLGLTAIIFPITVVKSGIKWDWLIMMGSTLFFLLFIYTDSSLVMWEGVLFVIFLTAFIFNSIYRSRKSQAEDIDKIEKIRWSVNFNDIVSLFKTSNSQIPLTLAIFAIIISSIGLYFGAELLIDGSVAIAKHFDVSERIIAVSIIALGTSVPELATSITAAFKGEMEISIGNIIGSNIFNLLGILGVTSIIKSIEITDVNLYKDIFWQIGLSLLLIILIIPIVRNKGVLGKIGSLFTYFSRKGKDGGVVSRKEGLLLFVLYITYLVWVFV